MTLTHCAPYFLLNTAVGLTSSYFEDVGQFMCLCVCALMHQQCVLWGNLNGNFFLKTVLMLLHVLLSLLYVAYTAR